MGTQPSPASLRPSLAASPLSLGTSIDAPVHSPPASRLDILRRFDEAFSEAPAIESHEIEEAFRLRYQVYCLDRGFEEVTSCPMGMERDQFDDYALHSLLIERTAKRAIGTVRLVKPEATPSWVSKLPLADYAHVDSIEELMRLPAGSTAEVSRFAIARSALSQLRVLPTTEAKAPEGEAPVPNWREKLLPFMSLGLIRGLVRLSLAHGVTHWCLAAEPSLLRRLRTFGLHFKDAGPLVDHRGLRQICYAELGNLLERAEAERPEFWHVITQGGFLLPASAAKKAA